MTSLEFVHSERDSFSPRKNHQGFEVKHPGLDFDPPSFLSGFCDRSKGSNSSSPDSLPTSTSNSIKGAYSDTSEAGSEDTVPSSVAADHLNGSAHTTNIIHSKNLHYESDGNTMTEPTPNTQNNLISKVQSRKTISQEVPDESIEANSSRLQPKAALESKPLEDYFSKEAIPSSSKNNASKSSDIRPQRASKSSEHVRKHIVRASSDRPRRGTSFDQSERPNAPQFRSLRKLSTLLNSGTREENGCELSAAESEITRMKSVIVAKQIQKRKSALEDETFILGNKITEGHQNFVMAYNMLTGIRVAVSRCAGVMRTLHENDFRTTKKLTFGSDGSEMTPSSKYDFKFKDYSPEVFRELRSLFGIDQADYLMSITGKYILSELGSSGKSGSFFYYSRDYRFIIKTIHHSEHKQLRHILKNYYQHVKDNPNTMISQFYGLHRLKVNGGIKRIHFLVMNNLFPPHRDIHIKYDLKGSTWGRFTHVPEDITKKDDISNLTLKDLNWLQRQDKIKFGPEKKKIFMEQLEADIQFLKKINVMDYSLLLGIHDVKKGNSETVAKLSVFDPKSNLKAELVKTNPRDVNRDVDLPTDVFPGRSKYIFYGHNGGIRATNVNNEPIHEIYYLGVIDCLTNYSMKKRLETAWRSICHSRSIISAVPAHEYGDRFLSFIREGIFEEKVKIQ